MLANANNAFLNRTVSPTVMVACPWVTTALNRLCRRRMCGLPWMSMWKVKVCISRNLAYTTLARELALITSSVMLLLLKISCRTCHDILFNSVPTVIAVLTLAPLIVGW